MNIKQVRDTATRFGLQAAAADIAYRAARRVTEVTVLQGVTLTILGVEPKFLSDDAGCRWAFLDRDALHGALRRGNALGMDAAFIDAALGRGDRCYGALDGDDLVAYGWYSNRPTPVTSIADDMVLHFDPAYAYMYKGYTLPEHRGRRLHGIGMARALAAYVQEGARGLVSIVDAGNFASLASCYRLGYRAVGLIFHTRVAGKDFTFATHGCEEYGLRLEPARG
jgi:hypothetical protein